MTRPVITIVHTAPLLQAIDLLNANNLKRLPVVDGNDHLVGVITRSDILREIAFARNVLDVDDALFDWHCTVQDVELEPVPTVTVSQTTLAIAQVMRLNARKRVIVLDEKQRVVGIITEHDLLNRVQNGNRSAVLAAIQGQSTGTTVTLSQTATELMTSAVISVTPSSSAFEALRILLDNQMKRLPVIDAEGHLLGMVGRAGILHALLKQHR